MKRVTQVHPPDSVVQTVAVVVQTSLNSMVAMVVITPVVVEVEAQLAGQLQELEPRWLTVVAVDQELLYCAI